MLSLQKANRRLFSCHAIRLRNAATEEIYSRLVVGSKLQVQQLTQIYKLNDYCLVVLSLSALALGTQPHSGQWSSSFKQYKKQRAQRWREMLPYFLRKWKLRGMWDEMGRHWTADARTMREGKLPILLHRMGVKNSPKEVGQLNMIVNRNRPGWDTIKIVEGSTVLAQLNPCQKWIQIGPTSDKLGLQLVYPARDPKKLISLWASDLQEAQRDKDRWAAGLVPDYIGKGEYTNIFSGFHMPNECPVFSELLHLVAPAAGATTGE
jgi:hypothetical protein